MQSSHHSDSSTFTVDNSPSYITHNTFILSSSNTYCYKHKNDYLCTLFGTTKTHASYASSTSQTLGLTRMSCDVRGDGATLVGVAVGRGPSTDVSRRNQRALQEAAAQHCHEQGHGTVSLEGVRVECHVVCLQRKSV